MFLLLLADGRKVSPSLVIFFRFSFSSTSSTWFLFNKRDLADSSLVATKDAVIQSRSWNTKSTSVAFMLLPLIFAKKQTKPLKTAKFQSRATVLDSLGQSWYHRSLPSKSGRLPAGVYASSVLRLGLIPVTESHQMRNAALYFVRHQHCYGSIVIVTEIWNHRRCLYVFRIPVV